MDVSNVKTLTAAISSVAVFSLSACVVPEAPTAPPTSGTAPAQAATQASAKPVLTYKDDASALMKSCLDFVNENTSGPDRLVGLGYKKSRSFGSTKYTKSVPYSIAAEFSGALRFITLEEGRRSCVLRYSPLARDAGAALALLRSELITQGYKPSPTAAGSGSAREIFVRGNSTIAFSGTENFSSAGHFVSFFIRQFEG